MTEKELHDYFCFDRFLQVVNTKYEKELLKLEQDYHKNKINEKDFNKLWDKLVEEIKNGQKKKS